jgi:ubiquinone biosynthesis protein
VIRTLRNVKRLLAIARILARHDALFVFDELGSAPPLSFIGSAARLGQRLLGGRSGQPGRLGQRPGQRLALALHEAGPSFIKLGQALSTRPDLIGDEMATDLAELQDRLPAFPGAQARAIIEAELMAPMDRLFSSFEDEPVAAASIAQVHFAIDSAGREVAVKVLRPGIEDAFARDLDLFLWIAEMVERALPQWRRLKPVASLSVLAETIRLEMDLRYEAAAAAELAQNFQGDASFAVPAVDWQRTSRRVLTTERIAGMPIDERDAIVAAGLDPQAVLARASQAFFRQVFRDGFFHADLHPGNLFVRADGAIAVVDFGIMGRIDRRTRRYLGEMLLAFLSRDYRRAAEVHFEAGWVPADRSLDAFTQACRSIAEPIMDKPQHEISIARLLGQLFQVTETFAMETQPQLLLLQKTMLVAEGTGRKLCPEVNMWLLARPLIQEWMAENLSPQARAREGLSGVIAAVNRLPDLLRAVEESAAWLAQGRLSLDAETIRALADAQGRRGNGWLPWLTAAALAALAVAVLA